MNASFSASTSPAKAAYASLNHQSGVAQPFVSVGTKSASEPSDKQRHIAMENFSKGDDQ